MKKLTLLHNTVYKLTDTKFNGRHDFIGEYIGEDKDDIGSELIFKDGKGKFIYIDTDFLKDWHIEPVRYTVYYYELKSKWFVWDNQTNCLAGNGTVYKNEAEEQAEEYNKRHH